MCVDEPLQNEPPEDVPPGQELWERDPPEQESPPERNQPEQESPPEQEPPEPESLERDPPEPDPQERDPPEQESLERDPPERQAPEPESLEQQIRFVLEADRLKTVARQSRITGGTRRENSAEHSWHLALMALALGGHAPAGTDLCRVMAMVVVHDLVEIDAGDLFVYSDSAAHARQEVAERAAADRIFALLPPSQAVAARALWEEFEERRTPEARFARALDRLQPMLLNMQTDGGTWVAHDVPLDQVLSKVELIEEGSATLGSYAREMIAQAVERGFLRGSRPGRRVGEPL